MGLHVLLSDRRADEALPGLGALLLDLKTEELSVAAVPRCWRFGPRSSSSTPATTRAGTRGAPRRPRSRPGGPDGGRGRAPRPGALPVRTLADDLLYPGAPQARIRVRVAMLRRRAGGSPRPSFAWDRSSWTDSYAVTVAGRALDLTYKEFEPCRFLAEHPRRVFTRPRSCERSGGTISTAARGPWTSTSVVSARSSAPSTRASSRPSAVSATAGPRGSRRPRGIVGGMARTLLPSKLELRRWFRDAEARLLD